MKISFCRMNLKMNFLHSHVDYVPTNLADFSENRGERFHQDIGKMERRNQGLWDINMMANFCWILKKENPVKRRKCERNPLHRSLEDKIVRKRQ